MKKIIASVTATLLVLVAGCTSALQPKEREPVIDTNLIGTWLVRQAELSGKNFPVPSTFELKISGTRYHAGFPGNAALANDYGKIVLFGDEVAGQAARVDVVGEDGPNKGKRFPAIYRLNEKSNGRELEMCYDLSEKERPSEFVSREGTMLLRVTYTKK